MMDRIHAIPERTLALVGQVGEGMKHMVASGDRWLDAGAKLGALKGGSRMAVGLVRRHPAATVATIAGAGLLWYLAHRRAKQAENGEDSGTTRRVQARRGGNGGGNARKTAGRAGGARKSTRSRSQTTDNA